MLVPKYPYDRIFQYKCQTDKHCPASEDKIHKSGQGPNENGKIDKMVRRSLPPHLSSSGVALCAREIYTSA
jgi:hypothetical protein